MFVVDANILVYAFNLNAPQSGPAMNAIARWRRGPEAWFATWPIVYEFLRVATHPSVFERPRSFEDAWTFVEGLLSSPTFGILTETGRHPEVVRELVLEYRSLSGSIMHDLHTAALMREHGITEIRTSDAHFDRFAFLRVVNPLVG